MPNPEVIDPSIDEASSLREQWLGRLHDLAAQVQRWAERSGWRTRWIERSMSDSRLGPYRAPALLMQRETVEVILDPVGRFAPGTEGVVDLYLMPSYDDIASLCWIDGEWSLNHASRKSVAVAGIKPAEAMKLDEMTLTRVLEDLASHAS